MISYWFYRKLDLCLKVDGYKLVAKRSNRKWRKDPFIETKLQDILGEDAFDKKLIGIPKAEKLIKKLGESPEALLHGLYEKPDAGVILAPEEDKRKEVVASPIEIDFTDEKDFLC